MALSGHWPAIYGHNSLLTPDWADSDNQSHLLASGNYDTGIFSNLTFVPPFTSYSGNPPSLGGTPGNPVQIVPTTQLGLPTGTPNTYGWYSHTTSGSINMHTLTDALADHPDYLNFRWSGRFYVVDDITGYDSLVGAGAQPNTIAYIVTTRVKITADGVVSYNPTNDHYHNGLLANQNADWTGTDPVALDFTLLSVPAHATLYNGTAADGGYDVSATTGTKTYPTHHPANSTLLIELEVVITHVAYNSSTGLYTYTDDPPFTKTPDQVVLVFNRTEATARYGTGSYPTPYAQWLSSDMWDGQFIASAYADVTGAFTGLRVSFCPSARHGFFEPPQVLETAGCKEIGLTYLASGRCYLSYKVDSGGGTFVSYYRTSDTFGRGNWTARQTLASGQTLAQCSGRGMGQAFRLELLGNKADGTCTIWHNRDGTGVGWHPHPLANAYGPTGAICWLGNGWGLLLRDATTQKIYFRRVKVIDQDDLAPIDTGYIGWPTALIMLRNGLLIPQVYTSDLLTGQGSRDGGLTWKNPAGAPTTPPDPFTTNPGTLGTDGDIYYLFGGVGLTQGLIPF